LQRHASLWIIRRKSDVLQESVAIPAIARMKTATTSWLAPGADEQARRAARGT